MGSKIKIKGGAVRNDNYFFLWKGQKWIAPSIYSLFNDISKIKVGCETNIYVKTPEFIGYLHYGT